MKNFKSFSLLSLSITLFVASCSSNSSEEDYNENLNNSLFAKQSNRLLWDADLVANKHNEGLDYIYNHLNQAPLSNQENTNTFLDNKTSEFILLNGLEQQYAGNIPDLIIDEDIIEFENGISTNQSPDFSYEYFYLKNLLLDENKSTADKINSLANYQPTRNIKDDLEYTMIITMSKVGKASLEYWNTKGSSWQAAVGNTEAKFNWGIIGFSDAGGAVTAAAGLWASGTGAAMIAAGGPGGAVGVGLVIAAGAIGSSATAFVGQAIFGGWF